MDPSTILPVEQASYSLRAPLFWFINLVSKLTSILQGTRSVAKRAGRG